MRDRVQALHAVVKLIENDSHSSIRKNHQDRLKSALQKLDVVPDLDQINNGTPSEDEEGSIKRVRKSEMCLSELKGVRRSGRG